MIGQSEEYKKMGTENRSQFDTSPVSEIKGKAFILLRKDLEMPEGKLAVQVGHAIDQVWAYAHSGNCSSTEEDDFHEWVNHGRRKIILRLNDEADMIKVKAKLEADGVSVFDVYDFGINIFGGLTYTGLVVFPTDNEIKALKRVRVY